MFKKISFTLFLSSFLYAEWTVGLSSSSTFENAKNFKKTLSKEIQKDVFIEKVDNSTFRVNYGVFSSYNDSKEKLNSLKERYDYFYDIYVRKTNQKEINLSNPTKDKNSSPDTNIPLKNQNKIVTNDNVKNKTNYYVDNSATKTEYFYDFQNAEVKKDNKKPKKINYNNNNYNYEMNNDEYIIGLNLKIASVNSSGDFKFGANGSKVNQKKDLGTSYKITAIPQLYYKNDKHKVYSSYENYKFSGNNKISNNLTLDNYTYLASNKLESKLQTVILDFGYRYNFMNTDIGFDFINYNKKINLNNDVNRTNINLDYNIYAIGIDKDLTYDRYLAQMGFKYGLDRNIDYLNYNMGLGVKDVYIDDSLLILGYQKTKLNINDGEIYNGTSNYDALYLDFKKSF